MWPLFIGRLVRKIRSEDKNSTIPVGIEYAVSGVLIAMLFAMLFIVKSHIFFE